jgi:hypothetical protein
MQPSKDKESSQEEELILVELTSDELRFIEQHRAIYGEVKAGVTYSEKPRYLETTVETPDKIITAKYHPLTTKWREGSKKRNPNKITFAILHDGKSTLEIAGYRNSDRDKFFIFLNGERLRCQIDDWRRMFRGLNRLGHHLGIYGRKRYKKRRKKPPI